jgi:hypothetical protein
MKNPKLNNTGEHTEVVLLRQKEVKHKGLLGKQGKETALGLSALKEMKKKKFPSNGNNTEKGKKLKLAFYKKAEVESLSQERTMEKVLLDKELSEEAKLAIVRFWRWQEAKKNAAILGEEYMSAFLKVPKEDLAKVITETMA